MPRPRKNPIAELPAITAEQRAIQEANTVENSLPKQAPNAKNFKEAYESTGVPIQSIKVERFGPGADYPSNTVSTRYFDPSTGRTFQLSWSDSTIDAIETFCDMLEENGYLPCQSPDTPKSIVSRVPAAESDPLDEDKRIGRDRRGAQYRQSRMDDEEEGATPAQRKFMRQLRIANYDDPDLTKVEASELIEEKTARARPRGRY